MKKNPDIAILLPTRGLVHTQVEQAIEKIRNKTWLKVQIFRSFDKPIPDCLNSLIDEALPSGASHFWIIEEDTIPPLNSLEKLLAETAGIAFIDYAVNGWSCSARDAKTQEVLWCGLGCTMIKRYVFDLVDRPYFRSDKRLRLNTMEWREANKKDNYGGHDIWFMMQARKKGIEIAQVPGECDHLMVAEYGMRGVNNGLHEVIKREKISRLQIIDTTGGEE